MGTNRVPGPVDHRFRYVDLSLIKYVELDPGKRTRYLIHKSARPVGQNEDGANTLSVEDRRELTERVLTHIRGGRLLRISGRGRHVRLPFPTSVSLLRQDQSCVPRAPALFDIRTHVRSVNDVFSVVNQGTGQRVGPRPKPCCLEAIESSYRRGSR